MPYEMLATCPEETKEVLVEELRSLGATDVIPGYMIVSFTVNEDAFYRLHLRIQTASRLRLKIKEFAAKTPEMLFSQARRIHWGEVFDVEHGYLVDGMAGDRGEDAMSGNQISKQVRLAIEDSFAKNSGKIPKVDLKEPLVRVVAHVRNGRCIVSVDTAGKSMHKRGYKDDQHPAPLKETLAAAILRLAGYTGSEELVDPMCGSGTIAIEAAYIALNKAPLVHRKRGEFGFEYLKIFNKDKWRTVQDEIRLERLSDVPAKIHASDIDKSYLRMARDNALRARVEKHIEFSESAFEDLEKPAESGLLICNLPYGERLDDKKAEELKKFYQDVGTRLKHQWKGWRAALLTSTDSPYKFIGLKPSRKFNLLNSTIPVKLLFFDLYDGSKRGRGREDNPTLS